MLPACLVSTPKDVFIKPNQTKKVMNENFQRTQLEVMRLTQGGDLNAARAAIQAALVGQEAPVTPINTDPKDDALDVVARVVPQESVTQHPASPPMGKKGSPAPSAAHNSIRNAWSQAQAAFCTLQAAGGAQAWTRSLGAMGGFTNPPAPDLGAVHGEQFISGSYNSKEGARDYKLFIPAQAFDKPMPLIVMLHGCTQNPDDFAAGTAMNTLARTQGFFVLYPAQSRKASAQGCWNWFKHTHQARGRGEPSIIAGMTQEVMAKYKLDASRVYVAGLSAGGAMAAILGATYPDVYAAVGVHSGLAAGSASNLPSALGAMKSGSTGAAFPEVRVPTIVFHGDADSTVHHTNGDHVVAASAGRNSTTATEQIDTPDRRSTTRTVHSEVGGAVTTEYWKVHGAAHAWAGGSALGSYTDPRGPDASAEMVRFFMEHPKSTPGAAA